MKTLQTELPERYRKQALFPAIGADGQRRLAGRSVLLAGCGALGCVLADSMVRAGVGRVRIVDRDFVELSNLQRQTLFTEDDVTQHLPKAIAAARRLEKVNSQITIEPIVADIDYSNVLQFAAEADLILDGTDNFEIRYLINDVSLETGIPWIFTGCTGSSGQIMPVLPNWSACLRCLMHTPPPPGATETCDTAGVLGPAIGVMASMQAAMALRLLVASSARESGIPLRLTLIDVWEGTVQHMDVSRLREQTDCPACQHGERLWLQGSQRSGSSVLCGRNAVQVTPAEKLRISLPELASRLESVGQVTRNAFLIRVAIRESSGLLSANSPVEMTVFPDGRAIIQGTEDPSVARSLYSRYIGS